MAHGNSISRTGLSASPKRLRHAEQFRKPTRMDSIIAECAQTKPIQYSVRPFATAFNPYSRNCSILCNHPGPSEIKQVVKQVKELYIEGKGNFNTNNDDFLHMCDRNCELMHRNQIIDPAKAEFYHHYAASDSRPLTPTPTVTSNRTRISNGSFSSHPTRRCHTPDPVRTCATERKQLVLDLRRSHSQETVFCNAPSSELSVRIGGDISVITPSIEKSTVTEQPKNIRICEQEARKRSAELKAIQQLETNEPEPVVCINARNDANEEIESVRRRGKKKKKTKVGNSYRMNQEPETQITTIDPDSPNTSARPSGHISVVHKATKDESISTNNAPTRDGHYLRSNFITEDALRILRRGLNIDIVESAFEKFVCVFVCQKLAEFQ